jgi:hypothetical protein
MAACGFGEGLVGGGFEVYREARFGEVEGVFDHGDSAGWSGSPSFALATNFSSLGSSAYPSAGFLTEEVIRNAGAFGIADPAHDLAPTGAYRDSLGMGHLRYEQRYNGVPVFGGELTAHYLASGELSSITGRTLGVGESATTGIAGGMRKAPKRGL